jgi:adenosylhomocysteine nucleosidase
MALAAVTGLAAEARILRRLGLAAVATSGDPARIEAACARLLAEGAACLLSFGIAGALAPALAPGALIVPRRVVTEAGARFAADPAARDALCRKLAALGLAPIGADLLGRAAIAMTAAEKSALHRRTGAVAVDLESHVAAAAAARAGRPFLVLRAIADPAAFAVPQAAARGLDAEGRAAVLPVLRALLDRPGEIAALVRLAAHTRAALATLARAAPALA